MCTITLRLHAYFCAYIYFCAGRLCNVLRDRRRGEADKMEIKIARLKKEDKLRSIHSKIELNGDRIGNGGAVVRFHLVPNVRCMWCVVRTYQYISHHLEKCERRKEINVSAVPFLALLMRWARN